MKHAKAGRKLGQVSSIAKADPVLVMIERVEGMARSNHLSLRSSGSSLNVFGFDGGRR